MEIIAGPLEWLATDEENWLKFLQTPTGQRLLPKLAEETPALLPGGDTNAILIRAGEVRGIQLVMQRLLDLSHSQPQEKVPETVAYPAPENDAAWDDGQKLVLPEPES